MTASAPRLLVPSRCSVAEDDVAHHEELILPCVHSHPQHHDAPRESADAHGRGRPSAAGHDAARSGLAGRTSASVVVDADEPCVPGNLDLTSVGRAAIAVATVVGIASAFLNFVDGIWVV